MSELKITKNLYFAIHHFLINEWDPIGVGNIENAQDEYDKYIPMLYKMLVSHKSKQEICNYLWSLETEHIGLAGDKKRTEYYAELLMNLYKEF